MVFVFDKLIEIVMGKLVDAGIEKIASILKVKSEMEVLQRNVKNISLVLVDAESKKIESNSIALWLAELREVLYDAEDLLDDFAAARDGGSQIVQDIERYIPGVAKLKEAKVKNATSTILRNINSNLARITSGTSTLQLLASQPNADKKVCRYNSSRITDTCSNQLDSDIVGIDDDATHLVDRITGDSNREHSVFAITGMGGIGKTTLARKVFNHYLIKNHFDKTIWVCVSSTCSGEDLLKEIVRSIEKDYSESRVSHDELSSKVIEVVEGRRLFIILDDIWNANVWEKFLREPLLARTKYSRILITTRNEKVAKEMKSDHTHPMKEMDPSDGWPMLCKIVFEEEDNGDMNELADVGKKIVHKCKGLPLAIKVVGGVLRTTDRTVAAWTRVLSSRIWSIGGLPEDVLPSLLLSYEDLPSHLKRCFIYCSLFPEDFQFSRVILAYMWIAEGFIKKERGMTMEESAEEYYNELVMRNLLQVMPPLDEGKCRMHDLLRSLALFLSQNQYIYVDPENFHSSGLIKHRHLWFSVENMNEVPKEIIGQDYVRTLMLSGNSRIKNIPPQLLSGLRRIRVLDLGNIEIWTLPDSLGGLIQLRFLNISSAKLEKLPDSIKNLKNLETLIVSILTSRSLPNGIVKLYNLRHLLVSDRLRSMPNGLDNLKNLRVLSCFVVNHGARSRPYTPNMKELKDLSELTDLSIDHLERVANKKEAEEAAMKDKRSLKRLKLHCKPPKTQGISDEDTKKIENVFEGIKIPQKLTELSVDGFFGKQFPAHMIGSDLRQVKSLKLERCESLEKVPSLGDMPKLETLHITKLSSVANFGSEFYGELKFPKLKYLHLVEMAKLERIFEVKQGAFPCLIELSILYCPQLKSLGEGLQHATCLKTLIVDEVSKLESIENLSSISELQIYRNSRLISVKNLPSLKKMKIIESYALKVVQNVGELSSLSVSDVKMETLPVWLTSTVAPKKLKVEGSAKLVLTTFRSAEDWKFLKKCLYVEVKTHDKSEWMSYRKDLDRCDSNLSGSSGASSSSVTTSSPSVTITEIVTALWRKNSRYVKILWRSKLLPRFHFGTRWFIIEEA